MTDLKTIALLRKQLEQANIKYFNLHVVAEKYRMEFVNEKSINKDAIDKDILNTLIRLPHPDKHNNSEASTRATKFLLKLRKQ